MEGVLLSPFSCPLTPGGHPPPTPRRVVRGGKGGVSLGNRPCSSPISLIFPGHLSGAAQWPPEGLVTVSMARRHCPKIRPGTAVS